MMMRVKVNEMKEELKELKNYLMSELDADAFAEMNQSEFRGCQAALKLLNTSMELMDEQVDLMEAQDAKLDRILDILERAEERP